MAKKRKSKWIQGAVSTSKKGALRAQLGAKPGQPISSAKLQKASLAPGLLGQRARFALNVRGLGKRGG